MTQQHISFIKKFKKYSLFTAAALSIISLLSGCHMVILEPNGIIATDEKNLLVTSVLLMLLVVIPVIILTFWFAWKYRASNLKAKYTPNWGHSTALEIVWWTIPCLIIIVLATITWISTHKLDPYRPLDVKKKPIVIQVIALNWKWLFIYPEQNIATVNFVQLPVNVPITFKITSDAPMNSFMIPQLAGQIYAMEGMQTQLHLMADEEGDFDGLSTNYSGDGFSEMRFIARVSSQAAFDQWVNKVQNSHNKLSVTAYNQLMKPTVGAPVAYYSPVENELFKKVIMKFKTPDAQTLQYPNKQIELK